MAEQSETPNKKNRGGQAGNFNALKFGIYSKRFINAHKKLATQASLTSLKDEILLCRMLVLQLQDIIHEEQTNEKKLNAMQIIATLTARIERLITAEKTLNGSASDLERALFEIASQVRNGR